MGDLDDALALEYIYGHSPELELTLQERKDLADAYLRSKRLRMKAYKLLRGELPQEEVA